MTPRIILITGANRGIGFSILRALATATPTDSYILAARSQSSIDQAIASLRAIPEFSSTIKDIVIEGIVLDVTDDSSILAAVEAVTARFGRLDVLVNNAGIAQLPPPTLPETRAAFTAVLDVNVASVANVTLAFLPLLLATPTHNPTLTHEHTQPVPPLVINISSARASLSRSTTGALPPTASLPYSVSKTALNALTIEFAKSYPAVSFQCASPGHCRTAFNGFRGARDPVEEAQVVVLIVRGSLVGGAEGVGKGKGHEVGFWETVGDGMDLVRVPW